MNRTKPHTYIVLFFLALIPLFFVGCNAKPTNVYQGYVEGELIYMASPFSGTLESIFVTRGEKVKKGKPLFTLDPQPELSQLSQAKEKLAQAKATLENIRKGQRKTVLEAKLARITQTKAELVFALERQRRMDKLYLKRAIDKNSLDAAVANYQAKLAILKLYEANYDEAKLGGRKYLILAQEAAVKAAEEIVVKASWSFKQKSLVAPIDSIIFETFFRQGEWVPPGKPVLALLAPKYIRIIFFIPERKLHSIKLGSPVKITCDSCQRSYDAKISYISPQSEYTPPVIYSRENNYKLIYRIKAIPKLSEAMQFHPGQPVYVKLSLNNDE